MNKKHTVITELYDLCKNRHHFTITDAELKDVCRKHRFGNPFDATKFDHTAVLPEALLNDDVFIVTLGGGLHQFVTGIKLGYHTFEEITDADKIDWRYRRSVLNDINSSESNTLSMAYNQRIMHDFLYEDITASPKVYGSNRTQIPLKYHIGSHPIDAERVQVEIDYTMEYQGRVTAFEAKNRVRKDFNVFQLFNPYRYYLRSTAQKAVDSIMCCYVVRVSRDRLRLYLYSFQDPERPTSIRLERKAEYRLVPR